MRTTILLIAASLALGGCGKGSKQADALDHAAGQADPVAAAQMRNAADAIRDSGSDANLSDPNSPAQAAMANAGAAAAGTPPATNRADTGLGTSQLVTPGQPAQAVTGADTPGASTHKANERVPNSPGSRR